MLVSLTHHVDDALTGQELEDAVAGDHKEWGRGGQLPPLQFGFGKHADALSSCKDRVARQITAA